MDDKVTEAVSQHFAGANTDRGSGWASISTDGKLIAFRSLLSADLDNLQHGRHIFVWEVPQQRSAIAGPDGNPTGWNDACTTGTDNGTRHAPELSSDTKLRPARVVFAAASEDGCRMVFRDLNGNDIVRGFGPDGGEVLEPAISADGEVIAWAAKSTTQQVYACAMDGGSYGIEECPGSR